MIQHLMQSGVHMCACVAMAAALHDCALYSILVPWLILTERAEIRPTSTIQKRMMAKKAEQSLVT